MPKCDATVTRLIRQPRQLRQLRRQAIALAVVPVFLALSACASPLPDVEREEAAKEAVESSNASCTKLGTYLIIPSSNGSFPLLPASTPDAGSTPLVRLSSTHLKNDPATVDVSVALFVPGGPSSKELPGLVVGQEATFGGYTIKITSICDGEVLFDVVEQPD